MSGRKVRLFRQRGTAGIDLDGVVEGDVVDMQPDALVGIGKVAPGIRGVDEAKPNHAAGETRQVHEADLIEPFAPVVAWVFAGTGLPIDVGPGRAVVRRDLDHGLLVRRRPGQAGIEVQRRRVAEQNVPIQLEPLIGRIGWPMGQMKGVVPGADDGIRNQCIGVVGAVDDCGVGALLRPLRHAARGSDSCRHS